MNRLEQFAVALTVALVGTTAALHYGGAAPLVTFVVATVALGGSAWIVSFATENVGAHVGPAATGLLQSTLGNLPELFVVIFALRAGEHVVAQSAIVGSLFATALLVLGVTIIAGALASPDRVMHFHPKVARETSTLLLVCVFIIVIVGLALSGGGAATHHVRLISAVTAGLLLTVYLAWAIPYARSDRGAQHDGAAARLHIVQALVLLVGAGVAAAFVSEWFVDALSPAIHQLHVSQAFAGLVIVAIASNAVEHVVGVVLAARRQADLAIAVVVNSVAQIAAFVFPALVLISLATPTLLTFALRPIFIGALAVTAIVVWQITDDGDGHVYEGWALIATYLALAIITLYE